MEIMKTAIARLIEGHDLKQAEIYNVMKTIMDGAATPSQIAGFLVALRNKGETEAEIAGCALAMRDAALPLAVKSRDAVDICGTGGDGKFSLNLSTAAAFVVAGAGLPVAKHGNRSVSSRCGSADVLEVMGVRIDTPSVVVEQEIDTAGIGFIFAPNFHPAMKHAMPTRRELGIRTIFNLLGPLTNPARTRVQLIGVYRPELTKTIAAVLAKMGHVAGLVVHSNGWDEITLQGKTQVTEMFRGKIRNHFWSHKDFGLPSVPVAKVKGHDARKNAKLIIDMMRGKKSPARHVVIANAAALIWIAEKGFRKEIPLKAAVKRAEESIDSGSAWGKFEKMASMSHSVM